MHIEYFADGNSECPLILLYGSSPSDALNLSLAIERVAHGLVDQLVVHAFPGYISVNNCQLFLKLGQSDRGIRRLGREHSFTCTLRKETWLAMIGLVEPFTKADRKESDSAFQYLNENSSIRLLISTMRAW
jgi:hypothetical protein